MSLIHAIYQDGVFKPRHPVSLPEGCEVTVEPTTPQSADALTPLDRELRWLTTRTPAEVERARERVFGKSRPPRAIPEGKTLSDMVEGKWPGDETDEQVRAALERLS